MKDWKERLNEMPKVRRGKHKHAAVALLAAQTLGIDIRSMAEIGVFQGRSANVYAKQLPGAALFLVDPWRSDTGKTLRVNIDDAGWDGIYRDVVHRLGDKQNVGILRMPSAQAAFILGNAGARFDFVMLDGNHAFNGLLKDLVCWLPLMRDGGLICGHDYNEKRGYPGVKRAVRVVFREEYVVLQAKVWAHQCRA